MKNAQAPGEENIVVFANVFGYTRDDYERTIQILNEGKGIAAYELNVSCPTLRRAAFILQRSALAREVVRKAKRSAEKRHRQAFLPTSPAFR